MQSTKVRHFDFIDALRGIAAMGVIATHCGGFASGLPWKAGYAVGLGAEGVQLFFMLSAVTLLSSWHARAAAEVYPATAFYLRRFFRIAPMFWVALVFYTAAGAYWPSLHNQAPASGHTIVLTALFAHGWSPNTINAAVPGGWSIADEMTFYLAFPLLVEVITNLRRSVIFFFIAAYLALAANQAAAGLFEQGPRYNPFIFWWLPNQLPIFALGFATYHLLPWARRASSRVIAALFLFASAVTAFMLVEPLPYWATLAAPAVWRDMVAGGGFMALILALSARPIGLFVNPVTRYLGKVSFSSYLVQFAVIDLLLAVTGGHQTSPALSIPIYAGSFIIVLIANTAVATITYNAVEKPLTRFGHALARRLNEVAPAAASEQSL